MTGQHRKPGGPVPGPGTFLVRPVDADTVREAIAGIAADAINQAAESLRKVREYCDQLDQAVARCVERSGDYPCTPCIERARIAKDIRALLPEIPEAAGEVDMDDREYPGGGEDDTAGTDSGN